MSTGLPLSLAASQELDMGNQEYFEIINQTSNDDKYYMELLNFSASKIKNIPADQKTLAVFIPIGDYVRTIEKDAKNDGRNSGLSEVLLTQTQMDNVFKKIDDFYAKSGCANDYDEGIETDKYLIKNGIWNYHQSSLCGNKNLIIMIFNEARKPTNAPLTTTLSSDHTLSHITLHEAYHSFQNIGSCQSWDMPPYQFLTEGGAEYFSTYYMLERENRLDELNNHMLEEVMRRDVEDPSTLVHEGAPHMKGLAAINLMIQQGWVEQSSILDGSFFSDCRGVRQLLLGSDKLKYLNDNWYKIEKHNGNYRFNSLMSDDEAMAQKYRIENSFNGVQEEIETVSIEESYEDILLKSARIDAKQKISGFTFTQANYHKMVKKDGVLVKSAPETEITGWYQFIPRENDWHTGIIFFEKGQLKWKNEAGVEWNLQPDINNNKLITGEDNPYQTKYEPDFRLIKTSEKSSSKKLPDNSKFSRNRYGFKCNSGFKREGNNMCTKDLAIAQKIAEAIKTSEKSKSVSQSEEYPTVDYNTKLDEVCRGLINNNWNSYLNINKNEFNSKGYMFVVAGEDGRCESGIGSNKEHALNECTKWQEENNIIGVCELYAEGEEVVWDGHLKPSK
ncbi:hypothetical protein N9K59_04835 [Candidatus Thioglobus sp.]|nr:hypothetical protein [Candidatus Thioglobus sp.]